MDGSFFDVSDYSFLVTDYSFSGLDAYLGRLSSDFSVGKFSVLEYILALHSFASVIQVLTRLHYLSLAQYFYLDHVRSDCMSIRPLVYVPLRDRNKLKNESECASNG